MSPYTNNSRQNRGRGGSNRHDSGRSDFMTVLLFYVLPFIVVNSIIFILVTAAPKGDLTIGEATNFTTTTMELKIKSLLPKNRLQDLHGDTRLQRNRKSEFNSL